MDGNLRSGVDLFLYESGGVDELSHDYTICNRYG